MHRRISRIAPRGAFTLIEVMIAVTILAVMGGLVVGVMMNTLKARDMLAESDSVQQSARVALSRISQELRLAYLTGNTNAVGTYRTVFVAQDQETMDTLWFATQAHKRLYKNSREADQAEVTLWTEEDPEDNGLAVLLHRESPRIDHEPDKEGTVLPLAHGVKRFDVKFLDSQTAEWRDNWDSTGIETPQRLPRAAKIILVISSPDVEDKGELKDYTFVTTVLLEYAAQMTPQSGSDEGGSSGGGSE